MLLSLLVGLSFAPLLILFFNNPALLFFQSDVHGGLFLFFDQPLSPLTVSLKILSLAFMLFCVLIAWMDHSVRGGQLPILIALSLVMCGVINFSHLVFINLLQAKGEVDYESVLFGLSVSRLSIAIIYIFGVFLLLLGLDDEQKGNKKKLAWTSVIFLLVFIGIPLFFIKLRGVSDVKSLWIKYHLNWDLLSGFLFVFGGIFPMRFVYRLQPKPIYSSLLLGSLSLLIGQIILGIAWYARSDLGWYANAKELITCVELSFFCTSAIFLIGFVTDLAKISRKEKEALDLLVETQGHLAERSMELESKNIELEKSNNEITQINEHISLIIETAQDAFIALDAQGIVSEWNKQAEKIFGFKKDEVVGKTLTAVVIPLEFSQQLERDIRSYFNDGLSPVLNRRLEVKAIHKDSHEFPAELSISIYKQGDAYTFNAFVRDITDLKRAEKELGDRAEELARSNSDLEQFAYVASHDLQEPLRMVGSYTQLLIRKFDSYMDDDAREFAGYIKDGVARMQALIRDLLEYSRVGTRGKNLSLVSLNDILQQTLDNLKIAINESQAQVVVEGSLPQIKGDTVQLIQLFQNLIGNAIKFRADKAPVVRIWAVKKGAFWEINVADNGIGIDPKFYEKIFIIFQRLHSSSHYQGTGIGLAVCKKIVERHGGKISVESQKEAGARFYFTFPVVKG